MLGASFGHVLEQILICKKSVDTAGLQRFPRFVRESASRTMHLAAAAKAVAAVAAAVCAASNEVR